MLDGIYLSALNKQEIMADNMIRTVTATLAMFQAIPSLAAASEGQNQAPSMFPSGATPPFPFPTGPAGAGMPVGGPDGAMGPPGSMEGPPGGPEDLGPPPILTAPQMAVSYRHIYKIRLRG